MNIYGYQQSYKRMTQHIKDIEARDSPSATLLRKLTLAKRNCANKIRELKNAKKK